MLSWRNKVKEKRRDEKKVHKATPKRSPYLEYATCVRNHTTHSTGKRTGKNDSDKNLNSSNSAPPPRRHGVCRCRCTARGSGT